jgi:hypothetical protein
VSVGYRQLARVPSTISTFLASANCRRRSFRSATVSNSATAAPRARSGVGRSGSRRWLTRPGTRTTGPRPGPADLDPELQRLLLGGPADGLGDGGWGNGCPFALSWSVCDRMKDPNLRWPKEMTGGKSAQPFVDDVIG